MNYRTQSDWLDQPVHAGDFEGELSEERLIASVPSVTAPGTHPQRAAEYRYLPTIELVRELLRAQFRLRVAAEGLAWSADQTYTTHVLRFLPPSARAIDEEHFELLLNNSPDGGPCHYELVLGLFRRVCTNGLVVARARGTELVPYRGDILSDVVEKAGVLLARSTTYERAIEGMKRAVLDGSAQLQFASMALDQWESRLRQRSARTVNRTHPGSLLGVKPRQLLSARRPADEGNTLWLTFQRVQENLVRGGVRQQRSGQSAATPPVTAPDADLLLNGDLWVIAELFLRLASRRDNSAIDVENEGLPVCRREPTVAA